MSMLFFKESLSKCNAVSGKSFVVANQRGETLADYVRRVRVQVKDFSLSEVKRNSNNEIDGSYVSRIENGQIKNVTPEKLSALAKGLQVPEDELFAVARGKHLSQVEISNAHLARLCKTFERLPDASKQELLPVVKMIADEVDRRLAAHAPPRARVVEIEPLDVAAAPQRKKSKR